MNIPNTLTFIRFVLVPVFVFVFFSSFENAMLIALLVFLFAGLTDVLDGYIARKFDMVTRWGAILDPLADKIMALTVLISLTIKNIIPSWVLFVIAIKELLMVIGAVILFKRGTFVPAKIYGKSATVLFYIAVLTIEFLDRTIGLLFMYATVLTALFALFKYFGNFKTAHKKA